ncbi:uncharacterized protein ACHE_60293A [Aspergillus chevalieri]|uniref:Ankyrin repeat protein n=1 Tax=Aspergillus chevalieri TaxID=182096 RepID=A0A7R7ZRK0_ASPCH|nr:uncharacterized protein ACHE_60293A [Aspergillus chevalieri]BCR90407.1 hypothetical protein ACHE_60293A [Aspergillus chevalieri]
MTLLMLSNELVLEIAGYLKYESDINVLMQVSGRLYYVLSPYLYRHNARYSEGSALVWAIQNNVAPAAQKAIEGGALGSLPKWYGPIYSETAISSGYNAFVKALESDFAEPEKWIQPILGIDAQGNEDSKYQYQLGKKNPLFLALLQGHDAVAQVMINYLKTPQTQRDGDRGGIQNVSGDTALEKLRLLGITLSKNEIHQLLRGASGRGDLATVKFITKWYSKAIDEASRTSDGQRPPLTMAALSGQVEVLRYLLSFGVDPNLGCASTKETPLYFAAFFGNAEIVQILLDYGACDFRESLAEEGDHSLRILGAAGERGHAEAAKLLLEHSNYKSKVPSSFWNYSSILITASTCGFTDMLQFVLDNDPEQYRKTQFGKRQFTCPYYQGSCLFRAVERSHKDIIALLLEYGADPYGTVQQVPFLEAITRGNMDIVELFLEKGIKINHRDKYEFSGRPLYYENTCTLGMAALCHAVRFPAIFRLILDKGVRINARSLVALVLRTEIARSGTKEITNILRGRGYLVETPEECQLYRCNMPIHETSQDGESRLLRIIALTRPFSPYVVQVLQDALTKGDSVTVNYLLERGCHPSLEHIEQDKRATSLELAAQVKDSKAAGATLDVLLHHGADMDALRTIHQPRWIYAYVREDDERHLTSARLLVERGANTDPKTSKWIQNSLTKSVNSDHSHVRTLRYLLQTICASGISLTELSIALAQLEDINKRTLRMDWRITRILENAYWRMKYPVPSP